MTMRNRFLAVGLFISLSILGGCIDPYHPSTTTTDPAYLVVDGFLNATDKSCSIQLSHTVPLNQNQAYTPVPETKAIVKIEEEGGASFNLPEASIGSYSATALAIDKSKKYRIRITTTSQKEYVSDYVPVVSTPPIDSVTWMLQRLGVEIDVNTHDPSNNTGYYTWSYVETWRYDAGYESDYVFINQKGETGIRNPLFYTCYQSANSSSLLLSSTAKISTNVISKFPLTIIPWESPKLSKKYSILVTQRGLTKAAYDYFEQVKKNTEDLGTLFGPLPSTIVGNLQCTSDPSQPVIGYFTAGEAASTRIFIAIYDFHRPKDVPRIVTGYEDCSLDSALFDKGPIIGELVQPIYAGMTVIGWTTSSLGCVDCRYHGGTLTKPDFWE